jgi:hypothetical protein
MTLSTFRLDQIATFLDEISPFAPQEKGITLAYKVWSKTSLLLLILSFMIDSHLVALG